MADEQNSSNLPAKIPKPLKQNPFKNGFVPTGKRRKNHSAYLTKRGLLKHMLEVDITVQDLPTHLADRLREILPGWFYDIERRFSMRQIMELVQLQLVFSRSEYVRQDAINAIKDRVDGKAVQKIQVEQAEAEPTEFKLPSGRVITI